MPIGRLKLLFMKWNIGKGSMDRNWVFSALRFASCFISRAFHSTVSPSESLKKWSRVLSAVRAWIKRLKLLKCSPAFAFDVAAMSSSESWKAVRSHESSLRCSYLWWMWLCRFSAEQPTQGNSFRVSQRQTGKQCRPRFHICPVAWWEVRRGN